MYWKAYDSFRSLHPLLQAVLCDVILILLASLLARVTSVIFDKAKEGHMVNSSGQQLNEEQLKETFYQATTQHWAHAEQIRWTLLYNYLMASTILLLAWATIFASQSSQQDTHAKSCVMVILALAGVLISVLWVALGMRASCFVEMYRDLGKMFEDPKQGENHGPFTRAAKHRDDITGIAAIASSRFVVRCVPGIFFVLYLILTFISFGL